MSTATATLDITKGQKVDITKTNPGLKKVGIGLGWDETQVKYDLDLFCFMLNAQGKECAPPVYFKNLDAPGIKHSGDNLTGKGDGDDELITIELAAVQTDCEKIAFYMNIFNAAPGDLLGKIPGAFSRAFNAENITETFCKYDLNEDYSSFNAVHIGDLYKHNGEWKFQAIGDGKNGDINDLRKAYL